MKQLLACLLSFLLSTSLWAANNQPAAVDGLWEARYKASDTPSARIRIKTLPSGELIGVIENAYPRPGENPPHTCTNCTGDNQDKPYKNLKILWGMMPSGDNEWDGGHLLNAESGEIYSGTMKLVNHDDTLEMSGYVIDPIFGKTTTWKRVKETK
ncbi:MAG: DUF2147 domain-containing protein [Gammaproteobacteria bacterium]